MSIRRLTHQRLGRNRIHFGFPGVPILVHCSLATKLILLVVVPLVLTLAVVLPVTVTGLNRLAKETSNERLNEEVSIIGQRFEDFEDSLNEIADDIAQSPDLLAAVRQSDAQRLIANLLSASIRRDLQHLEVFDANGVSLGLEHHFDGDLDPRAIQEMNALGLAELETTRVITTPMGWLLTAVRSLKDSGGFIGSVSVGKLIEVDTLSDLNFSRSDPLIIVVGDEGEVVSASHAASEPEMQAPITLDLDLVEVARMGQVVVGSATIDGTKQRSAYAPLELGSGSRGVFVVALTTSPVVGLRDQLIANHVMVTAALAPLVLGVGYMVTKTITMRILRLCDGAVEIANGNLSVRVEESAHDEVSTLAYEFNRMADSLN